jgi:hypothetical protein
MSPWLNQPAPGFGMSSASCAGFVLRPGAIRLVMAALALGLTSIEERITVDPAWSDLLDRIFPPEPEAAHVVLGTIAGSMITVVVDRIARETERILDELFRWCNPRPRRHRWNADAVGCRSLAPNQPRARAKVARRRGTHPEHGNSPDSGKIRKAHQGAAHGHGDVVSL